MSGFISKPSGGWLYSDKLISKQGVTYAIKYIGCIEVKVSMKQLDFKTRSSVAKLCINKVCEAAGLKTIDKKPRIEKKVGCAIGEEPKMNFAKTDINLNISSSCLTLTSIKTSQIIISHDMPRISFASGGDSDTMNFIAYIAKDINDWRACYVLECCGGLAKDVISTIGQAFELRYKQYIKPTKATLAKTHISSSSEADVDKDYYNDLPGKVPPDLGPPPVPPLPAVVIPYSTLPPVQSPNLIDLNSEPLLNIEARHEYVNDSAIFFNERDVFDMQPFNQHARRSPTKLDDKIAELKSEIWYHGPISRAEAEHLLQKDGDFLVRESPSTDGQYVLSGMQQNTKKHLLLIDPEGMVRTRDRMFQSVSHLIMYHCQHSLPIISSDSALLLQSPIPHSF